MSDTLNATDWLSLVAPAGAAELVAMQLDAVEHATRALDRSDPETLHDFRVAVRRLRSALRAYQRPLGLASSKRVRRTLRNVAHSTNSNRDADVHIAWITAQEQELDPAERHGAVWVCEQLETKKQEADTVLADSLASDLDDALRQIRRHLPTRKASHDTGGDGPHLRPSLADVTTTAVRALAEELATRLEAVTSPEHQTAMHQARIAGKHLRYLIAPFADDRTFPKAAALVEQLKTLQDTLGDLHDAHIFTQTLATLLPKAGTIGIDEISAAVCDPTLHDVTALQEALTRAQHHDPVTGMLALAKRLREREDAAYRTAASTWFGEHARTALANVETVAAAFVS
jgi:CHAD domain-containing protein